MSSRRKKTKKKNNSPHLRVKRPFHYQRAIKKALISLCFVAVVAIPIFVYFKQMQEEHDLSVLGNGTPTVVQIHDPGCQLCNQLKTNLGKVKGDYQDRIQFKTANIKTTKGARFANRYRVPHVTLLFFDKQGERVNTLQGVNTPNEIDQALTRLAR